MRGDFNYQQGYQAFGSGLDAADNPHDVSMHAHSLWLAGWADAMNHHWRNNMNASQEVWPFVPVEPPAVQVPPEEPTTGRRAVKVE